MVEFETLKSEEVPFGNNNFIEVARKRAIAEEGTNEFIAISRGFFAPDGSKRFKKSFTIPDTKEVVDFVCAKIQEMSNPAASQAVQKTIRPAAAEPAAESADEF